MAMGMAISWIAVPAQAVSISIGGPGSSCVTCQGASYALSYSGSALPDADPLHETFRITLTIDTSTLSLPGAVAVDAAAIKVSSSVFASVIADAPGGATSWNLVPGGISCGRLLGQWQRLRLRRLDRCGTGNGGRRHPLVRRSIRP